MKVTKFEKKKMITQKNKEYKSNLTFLKKVLSKKRILMTSYRKVKDCCHYTGNQRGAAHNISNLQFST